MKNKISLIALTFITLATPCFAQNSVTLTTYYPAPSGAYQTLRTDSMCVGQVCRSTTPPAAITNGLSVQGATTILGNTTIGVAGTTTANLAIHGSINPISSITATGQVQSNTLNVTSTSNFGGLLTVTGAGVSTTSITASEDSIFQKDVNGQAFYYISDERLKDHIMTIENPLDKVLALRGTSFTFKKTPDQKKIGLIAQEVEKIVPEVVRTDAEGMKSVEYGNLVALLIESVKAQQSQIKALEARVQQLEAQR